MKTSELIGELAEVIEKYGDLPAFYFSGSATHEPAVIAAQHRTGNSTWIWENIPPLTAAEVEEIMTAASPEAINEAWQRCGVPGDRRNIAAYLKATAHLEVQPGTLVNPINKALLEAVKGLMNAFVDDDTRPIIQESPLLKFARQAILEAEREGVNLGSPVPKGSNTEVRGDSSRLLQDLIDIRDYINRKGYDGWTRTMIDDAIRNAENRPEGREFYQPTSRNNRLLIQILRDIRDELNRSDNGYMDRLNRIAILVDDVLAKAEGHNV